MEIPKDKPRRVLSIFVLAMLNVSIMARPAQPASCGRVWIERDFLFYCSCLYFSLSPALWCPQNLRPDGQRIRDLHLGKRGFGRPLGLHGDLDAVGSQCGLVSGHLCRLSLSQCGLPHLTRPLPTNKIFRPFGHPLRDFGA